VIRQNRDIQQFQAHEVSSADLVKQPYALGFFTFGKNAVLKKDLC